MSAFCSTHPLTRLTFAVAMIAAAIISSHVILMLCQLLCVCYLIYTSDLSFILFRRGWSLLRWLLIPAFFIHLFSTPGHFLFPSWGAGPTGEGFILGAATAVTLTTMFFSAVLLSRTLSRKEWLALPLHLPKAGVRTYSYIYLISSLYPNLSQVVSSYKHRWNTQRNLRQTPMLFSALFHAAIYAGQLQAQQLWLRWQNHPPAIDARWGKSDLVWLIGSLFWFLLMTQL